MEEDDDDNVWNASAVIMDIDSGVFSVIVLAKPNANMKLICHMDAE